MALEHLDLDFGSGHDLGVVRSSPTSDSALSVEPAWNSLSLCPFAPPPRSCALSKLEKKKKRLWSMPDFEMFLCRNPLEQKVSNFPVG